MSFTWANPAAAVLLNAGAPPAEAPPLSSWSPVGVRPVLPIPRHRFSTVLAPPQPVVIPDAASWFPIRVARYPALDPAHHPRGRVVRPPLAIADPTITPIGEAGVATLAMAVESGATLTLQWLTDVQPMWSGKETRRSLLRWPRLSFDATAKLDDAKHREFLSLLAGQAASAPIFLLGLAYDAVLVTAASGTTLTVAGLAYTDWARTGQRVVVVKPDGTQADAVVASVGASTIVTTTDVSATATVGATIMPAHQVYLEPEQALRRWRVRRGEWSIAARAPRPFAVPTVGVGATVNTYDGLAVWDVGIQTPNASQPLRAGSALVDLGMRVGAVGWQTEADWLRQVRIESSAKADWQWLMRFCDTVRGRWKKWLLPSGRPDFVPTTDASSGTLTIEGGGTGQPNYVTNWFPSLAHRRLKLVKTDGTSAYRTVQSCVDNGGGTQDLVLDSALAGALDHVQLLEQARFDSDTLTVPWSGFSFVFESTAKVVQQ